MIKADKQQAVLTLHQEGKSKKGIARLLKIDPKTVRLIIKTGEIRTPGSRNDKKEIDEEHLRQLYHVCNGYIQRVYEILCEDDGRDIGYSTLSRLLHHLGISKPKKQRSPHIEEVPGEEMQHDTSDYQVTVGGKKLKLICSGLYFRYSKIRYIKFYRRFNRFSMKCFLHEALLFWGYCARRCIIDNTNLAIWYGSGSTAVFSPEMTAFAKQYGFQWYAHEIGHANRKAGKERNFYTVTSNFLPGRTFQSMNDINKQAFEWSTQRYANRPQSKTRLIPARLFENEQPSLIKLPPFIQAPYNPDKRLIDVYGYIAFDANYYWVPPVNTSKVKILEYADHICLFDGTRLLVKYPIPDESIRLQCFTPPDMSEQKRGQPKNRKKGCKEEEAYLRAIGETVSQYIDFVLSKESSVKLRPRFIRQLYRQAKKIVPELFERICQKALYFQVSEMNIVENIAHYLLAGANQKPLPEQPTGDYLKRQSYRDGRFTQENPLPTDL